MPDPLDSHATPAPSPTSASASARWIHLTWRRAVVAVLVIGGLWADHRHQTSPRAPMSRPVASATAGRATFNLQSVRALNDAGMSEALLGTDTRVVLVVSSGCAHCQAFLQELGRLAHGDSLPALTVLAVESTRAARALTRGAHLRARAVGPSVTTIPALVKYAGLVGTPTLLRVDESGRIVELSVGALTPKAAAPWLRTMRLGAAPKDAGGARAQSLAPVRPPARAGPGGPVSRTYRLAEPSDRGSTSG